jgi:hypothetical protein
MVVLFLTYGFGLAGLRSLMVKIGFVLEWGFRLLHMNLLLACNQRPPKY